MALAIVGCGLLPFGLLETLVLPKAGTSSRLQRYRSLGNMKGEGD